MSAFRLVNYCICVPSTISFVLCSYTILTKSPKAMTNYKYMVWATCFIVTHFDIAYSLLLCPINLTQISGLQYHGLLGTFFPQIGGILTLYYAANFLSVFVALNGCAVWREYALVTFKKRFFPILLQFIHLTLLLLFVAFFTLTFLELGADYNEQVIFVESKKHSGYIRGIAFFCIVDEKWSLLSPLIGYTTMAMIVLFLYGFKAFYRVSREIKNVTHHMSPQTVKLHKMLMRCIKLQIVSPIIFFATPIIVLLISNSLFHIALWFMSPYEASQLIPQIAQLALILPSFFSVAHSATVIYFTTPYKEFVASIFRKQDSQKISRPTSIVSTSS